MEEHVLSNRFTRLDEVWVLARLDRKKPSGITASGTVSLPDRANASVRFLATAASTSAEGTGDLYAGSTGEDAWRPVRADKEEIRGTEEVKRGNLAGRKRNIE